MIHNDEKETITVLIDYKVDRKLRPFYCVRCGKCVCEITGEAKVLVPGEPDGSEILELGMGTAVKCKGGIYNGKVMERIHCTAKYIFQ